MATRDLNLNIHEKRDGDAFQAAAKDLDQLANKTDVASDKFRKSAGNLKSFEVQIGQTQARIRELGQEFQRTGDRSLLGDLRKERSFLADLERMAKEVKGLAPDFSKFDSPFGGLADKISNPVMVGVIGGLASAAVLGAPTLGAMIAGTVAGTIGTGGVAGGVLMAVRDPHVKAAFGELKDTFLDEFFAHGDIFVGPVLESVHFLERALKEFNIGGAFAKNADEIYTIAHGIGDLVYNLMPGLNKAFDRMGPFADAAAEMLGELGASLGDLMDSVTASPGAVMGLEAAFNLLNNTIRAVGGFVEWASDAFEQFIFNLHGIAIAILALPAIPPPVRDSAIALLNATDDLINHGREFNDEADRGAHVVGTFGEAADSAAIATQIFNDALSDSYDKFLDWTGAEINVEDALDRFQEAIETSGGSLDVHEEKGRRALEGLKRFAEGALEAAKKKYIETGSIDEANAKYDEYRQELYDTFIAMGKTKEEAQQLTDKWLALQKLENIDKTFTIHQNVIRATYGPSQSTFGGGFQEFAEGGVVEGPRGSAQLIVAHAGERVLTEAQQRYAGAGMGWAGASSTQATPLVLNGSGLDSLVFEWLRTQIAARGGTLAVLGLRA